MSGTTITGHSHDHRPAAGGVEAVGRLRAPAPILAGPMLAVAVAGLAVNVAAVRGGWTLVRDSGLVLLEGVPMHLDRNDVARDLERAVPGLEEFHHMDIWSLDGRRLLATLHARPSSSAGAEAAATIKERLADDHGIDQATVEVERAACADAVDLRRARAG